MGRAGTLRAVITAGGTSEPVDDVRLLTNRSTGAFGTALADALCERGVEVTLLLADGARATPDPRVQCVRFRTVAALDAALDAALVRPPDLLLMAAAVSDYTPNRTAGKIRSDAETLTLTLTRTPKILPTLRGRCGPDTTIVGFKLLSGVDRAELVRIARAQCVGNLLDLTVANDARTFAPGSHPVVLVGPDTDVDIAGSKSDVARAIAEVLLRDRDVRSPWDRLRADFFSARPDAIGSALTPVFDGPRPVGLTATGVNDVGLWIHPSWRGRGHGDRWIRALGEGRRTVRMPAEHLGWLEARGYARIEEVQRDVRVRPPLARDDLQEAVSVGLLHLPTRTVLLGARRGAGDGLFALPGGHLGPGEDLLAGARRELSEETGLKLPEGPPLASTSVCVGLEGRAWRVTCAAWGLLGARPEPTATAELAADWVPAASALSGLPLAPGVRTALRRLFSLVEWTPC